MKYPDGVNPDDLPKTCEGICDDDGEVCGVSLENVHYMYRSMGFCEEHWSKNADALWEEHLMTREACR